MSSLDAPHHLRLVRADDRSDAPASDAAEVVARENRAAARNRALDPADPRWVLAARAYAQLDGTALTWERRQRVMRTAKRLGVRPFDANLIIAIVQDKARRGQNLSEAAGTLALLEAPGARGAARRTWLRWATAVACALAANAFLIWWLTA